MVNRSILCNCGIEANNHHLLESIASCDKKTTQLIMYFTINLAFTNYLDMLPNVTDSVPLIKDRTQFQQPLQIYLNIPHYDNSLYYRTIRLREFMTNYFLITVKKFFDLQQRNAMESLTLSSSKNFFFNEIVNIFIFASSIISVITITLVIYLFCKWKHARTIITSLILHKTKEVEANSGSNSETNNYECGTLAYIGMVLTVLSMITVIFLHYRKSKLCRGYRFSNIVEIVLFISDVQNYIRIKLCKTSGSIHLFKIKGTLKPGDINKTEQKLLMGYIRNKLE